MRSIVVGQMLARAILGKHSRALLAGAALAVSGMSARVPAVLAQPVVQAIPGSDGLALNAALNRLARNPRDIDALVDAGTAALAMGDVDAATGFFRRADQVAPGNPRVKAGLAGAMVRNGDPFGAIPLFEDAEKAGALDSALAADRGLAFDLVGDNVSAQRYYRQALARGANDDVTRRLALSQAIAGDRRGADATLSPLLQRQDKSSWRTRAFALAILGQTEEAVSIARTVLPADLASGIAPYLRYMPRLTPAQQAAAANFGTFPLPSEIGRDDSRVAQYAPISTRRPPVVAAVDTALVPKGEPLGRARTARQPARTERPARVAQDDGGGPLLSGVRRPAASGSSARGRNAARVAPPDLQPTRSRTAAVTAALAATPAAAPVASAAPANPPAVAAVTPPPVVAAPVAPPVAPRVSPPVAGPGFDLAALPGASSAPAAAQPAPAALTAAPVANSAPATASPPLATAEPAAAPPPPPPLPAPVPARRSLADAFSDLARPTIDAAPAPGAVDIRRIAVARPKADRAAAAKPAPPSHPSRIWVQVATGRDKAALAADWRRLIRRAADPFRAKKGYVSAWGQTNRLLTGPFESEAAANVFITQLRRADVDGPFLWTSPAGQVVDALAAR